MHNPLRPSPSDRDTGNRAPAIRNSCAQVHWVTAKEPGATSRRRPKRAAAAAVAPTVAPPARPTGSDNVNPRPPIVGVGASAGGLEAFTQLLRHLPTDTGMAFVLVQHLDPSRDSALAELLSKATLLPVREVENDLPVRPDHIYVIPPNSSLSIADAVLKLQPRSQSAGALRSIDYFLEALARDQRERAIGIVLSGTATDGTLGLEAIKAEGGLTFAQDDSARYDSMPRSAIAAGCVDFILKPEDIARELARIARHPLVAGQSSELITGTQDAWPPAMDRQRRETPPSFDSSVGSDHTESETAQGYSRGEGLKKILFLLRKHRGVDFSLYKSTTVLRRIARRMVLSKQETLEDYARYLHGNIEELDELYSDSLISVTSFFRNPEAFAVLKRSVFPKFLQQRGDDPVRIWVLGCSTGQEAYSIAMAFLECAMELPRARKLQVFATDLNETLLEKARHGLYAKNLTHDVSPERLRQFFVEEEGGHRISKSLREMVVFARQNLISDPPFSRMDLVSCRNLMIYLEPGLQKKLLPTFHYALKPEGVLFLGASESIGGFTDLFQPVDKKSKIYSRKAGAGLAFHLPVKVERSERSPALSRRSAISHLSGIDQAGPDSFRMELSSQREADRVTVNRYAPPGVLVNADLQILQFRGATGGFLEPPIGKASFDVLKMAREGLMLPLRAVIAKAKKENTTARKDNVPIDRDGVARLVNIEVIPLTNLREHCFLILFDEVDERGLRSRPPRERLHSAASRARPNKTDESRRIVELEQELAELRDYLQSMQEQHEAANEELQASNEEVQFANEELQSVNEELETSKEELESTNEELTTVNEEMANRNVELGRLNSDLINLQASTHLAIVLLGRDLTIRRFSVAAEKQFNLLAADVGRPVSALRHNLDLTDLGTFIGEVIAGAQEREREVRDRAGRWYSLRVRPYLTVGNEVDGAVLVLVDIDALKRTEQLATEARELAEATIQTVRDPLVILYSDLRIQSANEAFYRTFALSPAQTEGRSLFELDHGSWNMPNLRLLMEDIIPRNSFFDDLEVTHDFERIGPRTMLVNARTLLQVNGKPKLVLLGIRDITEVLAFQAELRVSEEKFKLLFQHSPLPKWAVRTGTLRFVDVNAAAVQLYGYSRDEFLRMNMFDLYTPEAATALRSILDSAPNQPIESQACQHRTKGGQIIDVEVRLVELALAGQRIWLGNVVDVTERKQSEEHQKLLLREMNHRVKNLFALTSGVVSLSARSGGTAQQMANSIRERLGALARAHDLIRPGMAGHSDEQTTLAALMRAILSPYVDPDATDESLRATISGPDVLIKGNAVTSLALVLHELATNAAKYGALSLPGGSIEVDWHLADGQLLLTWQERDGPALDGPPASEGFGSLLTRRAIGEQLGGQFSHDWRRKGLIIKLTVPLNRLAA